LIANLAVFYKGAMSLEDLESMPVDKLQDLNERANKIIKEAEQKAKSNGV
jgi:hypothetical protein